MGVQGDMLWESLDGSLALEQVMLEGGVASLAKDQEGDVFVWISSLLRALEDWESLYRVRGDEVCAEVVAEIAGALEQWGKERKREAGK